MSKGKCSNDQNEKESRITGIPQLGGIKRFFVVENAGGLGRMKKERAKSKT